MTKKAENDTKTPELKKNSIEKAKVLLKAYKLNMGHISKSCKQAGINSKTFYRWLKVPIFKQKIEEIDKSFINLAESVIRKRIKGFAYFEEYYETNKDGEMILNRRVKKQVLPDAGTAFEYLKAKGVEGYADKDKVKPNEKPQISIYFDNLTIEEMRTYIELQRKIQNAPESEQKQIPFKNE
ncbi:MAG: hypothetical protein ACRCW1_04530 [Anaerotignaceae bacterium]